ncbi:MAG: hypothetical protein D6814_00140 [Calditrichaeota bacterium]|nr:MAG: hypothetical protein D6814_00140 [Calditrichota bacterium]
MRNWIGSGWIICLFTIAVLQAEVAVANENFEINAPSNLQPGSQDKDLERAAMRLYKSALRHFESKAYWKATRELIVLLDFYETFSQIDGVLYYLGESLYEMNMYRSSNKVFRYLTNNYPGSEFLPNSLLGLQKIYYNIQDYDESLKFFTGLSTRYHNNKVLDGAYYYGGMAYYHQKKYDEAIKTLSKIRSRSEYFDYALYTVGLAFLKKKISHSPSKRFANSSPCRSSGPSGRM